MIGIYKITNKVNGKCYVGQSRDIEKRFLDHKRNTNWDNRPLYKAFRKYGLENFNFEVLEKCNLEDLNEKEIFYIKYYNSTIDGNGYNLTYGGEGNKAGWTLEHKKLFGNSRKGKNNPMFGKKLPIDCIKAKTKKYLETIAKKSDKEKQEWYRHISEGLKNKKISLEQKEKISKSLKEFYKKHPEKKQEISEKGKGRKMSKEFCQKLGERKKMEMSIYRKKVLQFDLNGNFIKCFDGLTNASQETGVAKCNISRCCIGKAHTAKGFIWKYDEEFNNKYRKPSFRKPTPKKALKGYAKEQPKQWKIVYQYDKEYNFIKKYNSLKEAALIYGNKSVISTVCRGLRPSAYGYRWSYKPIDKNDII